MNQRIHLYVSRKNLLTALMALCMVCSAVARIVIVGVKGIGFTGNVWDQIVLPIAATLLYAAIAALNGEEQFYKTAIPVWLLCIYSAFWGKHSIENTMTLVLFWIALFFAAFAYTDITSGKRPKSVWLLLPLDLAAMAMVVYYQRGLILQGQFRDYAFIVPDLLALLGAGVLVFAIRIHPQDTYHPTWGDRSDGRRVRSLPPMAQVVPYIMVQRNESSNFFQQAFEITVIDRYIRQKRKEGLTNFGFMHVLLTMYCRGIAKYPGLNRFIGGQKVYSRGEDIQFCLTVKKEMSAYSPDTVIKVHLSPRDTAKDVYEKVNREIEKVKNSPLNSDFDNTARLFTLIPGVLLKFAVWLLKLLDYFGLLPKFLLEVSPFHGSVFLTSMGSLGIPPIYHHLYDFGNLPVFGSFGMKRHAVELTEDGTPVNRKYVDFMFVLDERICDGFYYAAFFKYIKRFAMHPEQLDNPPEEIVADID